MVELVVWESEPPVPLIRMVYVPAAVAVQDIVAVPEPVKLEGVREPQANPAGDEPVSETVPAKWFNDVTPTVAYALVPDQVLKRNKCIRDRKRTRLNSSHDNKSYAVCCIVRKNKT